MFIIIIIIIIDPFLILFLVGWKMYSKDKIFS